MSHVHSDHNPSLSKVVLPHFSTFICFHSLLYFSFFSSPPHLPTRHYSIEPPSVRLFIPKICVTHTHTKAMAEKYFLCIIGEMDRLWFHQVILSSEPTPSVAPKPIKRPVSISESPSSPSSILSLPHEETSTDESPSPQKQVSSESISVPLQDDHSKEEKKERLARVTVLGSRIRSHSSSPSTQHCHRKFRKPATTSARKLLKSMSCRTLGELELDEVKGFMDLGFIFKRETLSPRMMSVVPGLQRLGLYQNKQHTKLQLVDAIETVQDNDIGAEEKRDTMRPYLSEAWLIKRPDSPLLNLRIPKSCSASNMKKHLRFWAKTVASEIHQE